MKIRAGIFLKSTSSAEDPVFGDATVFITEHNTNGTVGFVVNKPFPRRLNELEEFKTSRPFPIYNGGPVDREHLFFIHCRPDLIPDGALIYNDTYFGGDFKQAVACINNHNLTHQDIKIFLGYCGWDADELESEIREGGWLIEEGGVKEVFG